MKTGIDKMREIQARELRESIRMETEGDSETMKYKDGRKKARKMKYRIETKTEKETRP